MPGRLFGLCALAVAMSFSSVAVAVTTLHVPATYPTIQDAINASYDGDTILVSPGTYAEGINFGSREIEVRSTKGAEVTIIDPPSGRCFTAVGQEGPDAVLEGFTLTGGSDTWKGGGVYMSESSPTLVGCIITKNVVPNCCTSADSGGGGLFIYSASPTFIDCVISFNESATRGGGLCAMYSTVTLVDCVVRDNSTTTTNGSTRGGGIYQESGSMTIQGGQIIGNVANDRGGGIYGGVLTINDCEISSNSSQGSQGGGISNATISVTGGFISNNHAFSNGGGLHECQG